MNFLYIVYVSRQMVHKYFNHTANGGLGLYTVQHNTGIETKIDSTQVQIGNALLTDLTQLLKTALGCLACASQKSTTVYIKMKAKL